MGVDGEHTSHHGITLQQLFGSGEIDLSGMTHWCLLGDDGLLD
jgi:hypothetical protein